MRNIILYILLLVAIPVQSLYAEKISYREIEDVIIYNDYNAMKQLAENFRRKLTTTDSIVTKIDLNQTLGLLNLHMGKLTQARENFKKSLELSIEYFPNDSLRISSNTFFLLYAMDNSDLNQISIIPSDIVLNLATPYIPNDIRNFRVNTSHFIAGEGCYHRYIGFFDTPEEKFELAAKLALNEIGEKIRWSRLTYMMILDCLISTDVLAGKFEIALQTIEEFQAYLKQNYTNITFYYAESEIHKANILYQLGNYNKALDALNFANRILNHRKIITGLQTARISLITGDIYFDQKSYSSAKFFYKKARQIWTSDIYDPNAQFKCLNREMESLFKIGDNDEGELLDEEIERLTEKSLNMTEISNRLRIIAEYYSSLGFKPLAIDILKLTVDTTLNITLDYDNTLKLKNTLGALYQSAQNFPEAAKIYSDIIKDEKQRAHDIFAFLPEGQRNLYWGKKVPVMENIFRLNQEGTITISKGKVFEKKKSSNSLCSKVLYDASLLNKGLLLEAFLNMQRTILESGDRELINAFEELRNLQGADPARAETLEKTIISKTNTYGDYMDFTKIGWEDVRNGLKEGEVAIEFVVSENDSTQYYSAEILRSHYETPEHVFLFATAVGDKSLMNLDTYKDTRLYNKIWKKLGSHLEGCRSIYFAPAGDLYGVAIEYLPISETERINDIYSIYRLSSTKSLAKRENIANGNHTKSAVLYGGLDYNLDAENMEFYAQLAKGELRGSAANTDLLSMWDISSMKWGYLKGTEEEVKNISKILTGTSCNTKTITAGEGVEESFKSLSGNTPQLIHVATHGFVIKESKDMLKGTGLVFAGANNSNNNRSSTEDGLLTSHEISTMDLSGADLVVLSACQTALGNISGEGVFGLQRGFKKACAKTILMSLWEVDDWATSELMTSFYTHLSSGLSKTESLNKAQKHVMATCGTDPHLWAGFILLD